MEDIRTSAGVLWAFPVYFLLVPAGVCKRFIELIWDLSQEAVFRDKYAESLSTSIHFHNQCAHSYMAAVCEDLEMHFTESFSADMYDLLEKMWKDIYNKRIKPEMVKSLIRLLEEKQK